MFHGSISLSPVYLLLLVNFVSGCRLDLMYITLTVNITTQVSFISIVFNCLCCCHSSKKSLFGLHQQNKFSESKIQFKQASNCWERVLEAAELAYANKTKESITTQKLGSWDFWRIAIIVLNKGKSTIPLLFNDPEVVPSASDNAKLFAENFSKNSFLDDSGIFLPVFFY